MIMATTATEKKRKGDTGEQMAVPANRIEQYVVSEPEVQDVLSLVDGIELKKQETSKFTQDEAREYLEMERFEGERPFRDDHAKALMAAMKQGLFREEAVEIVYCTIKGTSKVYGLNGQHTASAVMSMPKGYLLKNVIKRSYVVDDEEHMRTLYSTIDNNAPRTQANMLVALLAGTPKFKKVPVEHIRLIGGGISYYMWDKGHERNQHGANDRASLMQGEYYHVVSNVAAVLANTSNRDSRHLLRAPVVAAMFATFRRGVNAAKEFWEGVRLGENMKANDPRYRLREELRDSSITIRGGQSSKRRVGREEVYRQCVFAWNAFCESRPITSLRVPLKIKGGRPKPFNPPADVMKHWPSVLPKK